MGRLICIDLGTPNSCVSFMHGLEAVVIPSSEVTRTTPSVVAITVSGERLVSQTAMRQALTHRSYGLPHNERLEFVGDAVLNCAVALVSGGGV